MAGDWIKIEIGMPDKPEVWQMAQALNIDADAVAGKLIRIWGWFDQHTEEGNAPTVTQSLLDRLVGVSGFCNAMIDVGWMLDDGETIECTNFDRHNGKTAKTRALTAKRVAKHKRNSNAKSNDENVTSELPREEKRRSNTSSSNEEDVGPTAITIPLNTGKEHPIPVSAVQEFESLYPAVDVMQQLRSMRAWCMSNPTKRKTKSGVMKFINAWLSKEQDKGGVSRGTHQQGRRLSVSERATEARRRHEASLEDDDEPVGAACSHLRS